MAVGAVVARILTQYSDKGSKAAQKDIAKMGKTFDNYSKKIVKSFGIAAAASAAFALKIGKDAVQAAISDQKSQALLANSLRNTVGATDSAISSVENHITLLQKQFNVVDDDLRPAMAKLTAATGSVASAQTLLDTALNLSASSGADLATATDAIAKATAGQFKGLKKLAPSLSLTTMKSKDFGKAIEEVNKATKGAAASRANTLEYRLKGLQIAFGEILETLGYALLPVIEKFAKILANDLLPKFEAWVNLNKDKLAAGLEKAAQAALSLFVAATAFGNWIVNNTDTIKTFAAILGTIWATSKVYAFAKAIGTVSLALRGMSLAALGSGAAGATGIGAAAAGAVPLAIAAGIGALTFGLSKISPRANAMKKAKATDKIFGGSNLPQSPSPSDISAGKMKVSTTSSVNAITQALADYKKIQDQINAATAKGTKDALTNQQKIYNLKLKELGITTTAQQDAITQFAIIKNLEKQAKLSGSSTIAIGASGSLPYGNSGSTTINVNAGSIVGSKEALIDAVRDGLGQLRSRGSLFESYAV